MNWRSIRFGLGYIALILSGGLALSFIVALLERDAGRLPLLWATAAAALAGGALTAAVRVRTIQFTDRDAVLLVTLAWVVAGVIGALPFLLSGRFAGFTDAVFESVSGFTTTGSSILDDVEILPPSLHFWRALTHWFGGLGIIVLMVAILPLFGASAPRLYRAEFSGFRSGRIKPRIAATASALWKIYVWFTLGGCVALRLVGMGWLDAACHAFSSIATGGFSTRNGSLEAFGNPAAEAVLIALMVVGAVNFTLHYRLFVLRQVRRFGSDLEVRWFFSMIALACVAMTAGLYLTSTGGVLHAVRLATFQVVSIMTATGLSSADFNLWAPFCQFLLLTLMFIGGCSGSTAGGLKVIRIAVLARVVKRAALGMFHRHKIVSIHTGEEIADEAAIESLLRVVYVSVMVNILVGLILTATGVDILSSLSAATTTMFNVGPGLGMVGPLSSFGHLHTLAKWALIVNMIAGRLEFFTFLVVFTPRFWSH